MLVLLNALFSSIDQSGRIEIIGNVVDRNTSQIKIWLKATREFNLGNYSTIAQPSISDLSIPQTIFQDGVGVTIWLRFLTNREAMQESSANEREDNNIRSHRFVLFQINGIVNPA